MATRTESRAVTGAATGATALIALVVAGFNLRTVLLEVPPILPSIKHDLQLDYTATGLLNSLPPLMLGLMAYPAALVIGRLGARTAMALALLAVAVTGLSRAFCQSAPPLFLATVLLSTSIALGQTSVPLAVQRWFPHAIGQVTAAYSTGLMVGEIAAASLTAPWLLQTFAGGQWRHTFILWSIPAVLALGLWLVVVPREDGQPSPADPVALRASPTLALRSLRVWQSGLVLGGGSLLFFGMDTWIPVYFSHLGRTDGPLALTVLTVAQLPSAVALMIWGRSLAGRPAALAGSGLVAVVALVAWFVAPASWDVVLAGVVGAASSAIFILGLSLPSLVMQGRHVAAISGIVLTVSYTLAFVGPFLGGVLWDSTHVAQTAFAPILAGAAMVTALGALMPDYRQQAEHA
jgi:CP family cyanate transporter-like MFS transporter